MPTLITLSEMAALGLDQSLNAGRSVGYKSTNATTTVTVRATTYTPQGTDAQRSVKSTSASDTSAGTGARKMKITYYKADGSGPFTDEVTLNGTTAVNTTASDIALLEKLEVSEVGSGGGNVGTIEIWTGTGATGSIWGSIAASDNQTYWSHHYVGLSKKCIITDLVAVGEAIAGIATLNSLNPINTAIPQKNLGTSYGYIGNESKQIIYEVPILVAGPAVIFLNCKPDASTASTTHAEFGWVDLSI